MLISPPFSELYECEKKFQHLCSANLQQEMDDLGVESVLNRLRKSMRLNSYSIHERLEEYFQICIYESKKLFRTGSKIMNIKDMNILELSEGLLTLT